MIEDSCRPLVSAVIPTRNRPEMVLRAVHSVLRQTIRDLEVVVIVDGPDQETVDALRTISDDRLRVISLPESVGGSDARNIGVQQARGRWIGLLDDDDEWLAEKCARQMPLAEKRSKASALIVSRFIARSPADGDRVQPLRLPSPDQPMAEYMFSPRCGFQTSTFFCERALLLRVPFTSGLRGCQDLDWFLRVTCDTDVEVLVCEEPLAVFHVPESRKSVSRGLDWQFRLDWGRSCRNLMTRRAYSLFVVQVCATKALELPFSMKTIFILFSECLFRGSATPIIVAHLAALFFFPANARQRIGAWLFRTSLRVGHNSVGLPPAQQGNGA